MKLKHHIDLYLVSIKKEREKVLSINSEDGGQRTMTKTHFAVQYQESARKEREGVFTLLFPPLYPPISIKTHLITSIMFVPGSLSKAVIDEDVGEAKRLLKMCKTCGYSQLPAVDFMELVQSAQQ